MPVISKQNLFLIPSYKMLPPIYIISSDHLTIVSGGGFECQTSLWETFGGCATLIFFPPVLLCMRSSFWCIRFLCIYYSKPAWFFPPSCKTESGVIISVLSFIFFRLDTRTRLLAHCSYAYHWPIIFLGSFSGVNQKNFHRWCEVGR